MAIPQAAKRISKLPLMDGDEIVKIQESTLEGTDPGGSTYTHSDAWGIGVDSLCRNDGTAIGPDGLIPGMHVGVDDGTAFIPMSRIAMRDTNGKIPASMLPGHIDDMIFGTLDVTDPSVTKFREPPPSGATTGHVYASPTQGTGELPPPENVIFCDTTTSIQYRYIQSQAQTYTDTVKHGFTEVPGTRTVNPGYGIEITKAADANLTVNAKKADFFTSYGVSAAETVNSTASNIPVDSVSTENSVIEATIASNRLTKLTNLIGGARYAMNLQLECTPVALSANIIDVSVTCGTVPAMMQQMDMSGPTSTATVLNYFCEFKQADNSTELTVTIAAEEAITVKTTRFTVFELL